MLLHHKSNFYYVKYHQFLVPPHLQAPCDPTGGLPSPRPYVRVRVESKNFVKLSCAPELVFTSSFKAIMNMILCVYIVVPAAHVRVLTICQHLNKIAPTTVAPHANVESCMSNNRSTLHTLYRRGRPPYIFHGARFSRPIPF